MGLGGDKLGGAVAEVGGHLKLGAPRLWDVAAGVIAVQEAGGTVMTKLPGQKRWQRMDALLPSWADPPPTYKELRQWVAPLVAGNKAVAPLVAYNMRGRFRPLTKIRQWARIVQRKRNPNR